MRSVLEIDQVRLGMLISVLQRQKSDSELVFDFGGFIPRGVDSYRGYYDQLAISYDSDWHTPMTVGAFLEKLRAAVGSTFTGWKGGDFVMHDYTPLWVSNPGECHNTAVTGVIDAGWRTVITTGWLDWLMAQ